MALRVIFMGTAELACASLAALRRAPGIDVIAVVTQPDKPSGRHLETKASPVKQLALREELPVLQPVKARDQAFVQELRSLKPDLIVVAAYGQILPADILSLPPLGCLNVHTSLLPKYRGASPIQSAILNGETETGVTIMLMDEGLDTGPILRQHSTLITDSDDAAGLHDRLAELGGELLVETIVAWKEKRISPQPQPSVGVSYAAKIKKADGQLDWAWTADKLVYKIRAFTPWPGAFTFWQPSVGGEKTKLLKVWRAVVSDFSGAPGEVTQACASGIVVACGAGSLTITSLQMEGGKRLSAAEFLAGHPIKPGTRFLRPNVLLA